MGTRLIPTFAKSARTSLRTFWVIARQLFHEVTGAMFGMFAFYGALAAWRGWHRGQTEWLVALCIVYSAVMAAFAAASFRKARRVR